MKQLTGQDNSFLEIDRTGLPQHLASVAIYNQATAPGGQVRFKQILELLESRLFVNDVARVFKGLQAACLQCAVRRQHGYLRCAGTRRSAPTLNLASGQ